MALVTIPNGFMWPYGAAWTRFATGTNATLDATGEKCAAIGYLYLQSGPGTSKTLSAAGGGNIQFRTNNVTFANGGTTLDIGLQDVTTSGVSVPQPDGTFDVKVTLTGGGGGISTTAWNTVSMTGGSGTKTLNHGDMFAIVWDMTARAGADSVQITPGTASLQGWVTGLPGFVVNTGGTWSAPASGNPNMIIVFDDGTVGWIDFGYPISVNVNDAFADATNPDERGMIFQVPFACTVEALWAFASVGNAAADFTLSLYSDPTGTPSAMASAAVLAEQIVFNGSGLVSVPLATAQSLSANTDYCMALRATGASNVTLIGETLGNEAHRVFWPAGTTMKKATRNNGSGAFTAENPAVTLYNMGVRVRQIHDGAGGSGGGNGGGPLIGGRLIR